MLEFLSPELFQIPQRYRFSSKSQPAAPVSPFSNVVLDTTKVQIFKQITTIQGDELVHTQLFQIPQRYRFSSKSQPKRTSTNTTFSCFRYHKGTDFQANHNRLTSRLLKMQLFQIPQRYRFSSKSQQFPTNEFKDLGCFRYHKGTDFQANHNLVVL